ncbi:MAG: DUF5050 domain-containing protein [Flavobacteriaceae bacterium]
MKTATLRPANLVFVVTFLLGITVFGQESTSSKSTIHSIAYTAMPSGIIKTYQNDDTSKPTMISTHQKGGYVAWSPNGKQIVFYAKYDNRKTWSIHIMNSDGSHRKRLTHEKNVWDSAPAWSPDGKKIVFTRGYKNSEGVWQAEIWLMNPDGSEQTQIKALRGSNPYFTPDGRIVFSSEHPDKKSEICIADVDGKNIVQLTHTEADEWHPDVSPDGKQIAFMSNKDGNYEIYVMDIDGTNQKRLTNNDTNDWYPSWSPDGSKIAFSKVIGAERTDRAIYMMNNDGSSMEKIIARGTHPFWIKTVQPRMASPFQFPPLEGPYMGQDPPGMVAEPFAPGIISTKGWEVEGVFVPGMKEFYFTTSAGESFPSVVIGFRMENNVWKKHVEFKRNGEPAFSPDGQRMHMAKGYKDRMGEGWSERKSLGPLFDRDDWGIMRLTASSKGTYVFDDYKSKDVIRISTIKDGKRQPPVLMGPIVNSGEWTAHPFIAPDESYLIWDSEREDGFGDSDLYISFKQPDGSWGPAINMGAEVNTDKWEAYASVTSDGKYILFNRGVDPENRNTDIYWVDAGIIERLRPKP